MKLDRECRGAGERISAQMAVGLQLTGRGVKLQLAYVNRAVMLGIGGVDQAAGGGLPLPAE